MSATFLLSSLPSLELGAVAPFSVEEYRRRCDGVEGVNLSDFDAVVAGVAGSHQFTADYANVLAEIKNATAALRASKWEGENIRISERSYSGYHVDLHQKLSDAINIQNPLEREIAFERARWQIVDELAGIDYFSEAKIYAYIVKLQINNRLAGLNEEAGKTAVENFIKANDHEVSN
ncbi:MAG: DUF2764 domain-containing protein [Fibromonadaceae bacterium]|jgi:hypothetical protein|nr:DUF2764 domain-containing protein [Fibromonadaceae bacterium]